MATNTLSVIDKITRQAAVVLHEKLSFIGHVNRGYDKEFAEVGAKIGETLRVRMPWEGTVTTGANYTPPDYDETYVNVPVSTQLLAPLPAFTTRELAMSMDEITKRVIEPATSKLASQAEYLMLADVMPEINNVVGTPGASGGFTLGDVGVGRAYLRGACAPNDGTNIAMVDSLSSANMVNSLKGLFQDASSVSKQYKEGVMGRTGGFDFVENDRMVSHVNGAHAGSLTLNATPADGATTVAIAGLTATTGTKTKGTTFTIAGVYAVHHETKQQLSYLKQFVAASTATANGSGVATVTLSPVPQLAGNRQNISAAPTSGAVVTIKTGTASTTYSQGMLFHPDAFVFATADLVLPKNVELASRQVFEGISIRFVQDYVLGTDIMGARLDVMCGWKTLRPSLAVRVTN